MSEAAAIALVLAGVLCAGMFTNRLVRRRLVSFNEKVVCVTGGSRGLGLALAREFAAEWARLALVARDSAELDRAEADLHTRGSTVLTIAEDLRRPGCAEDVMEKIIARFGRLDVLINNAGVITVGPLENMTTSVFPFPGLMRTGSHVQARFKGRRNQEFGWFALGSATPITSISAARAACRIIRACRAGKPQLIVTFQVRLAAVANALLPNLSARTFALADRILPAPSKDSLEALPGRQCRGNFPPPILMALGDRASRRYSEIN